MYVVNQADLPASTISRQFEGADHDGVEISFFLVDAPPGSGPRLHRHPYAEIFFVQEGEVTITDGETERVVGAGNVVVVPAGEPHGFKNKGEGPLRQIAISLSPRFETEWLEPQTTT